MIYFQGLWVHQGFIENNRSRLNEINRIFCWKTWKIGIKSNIYIYGPEISNRYSNHTHNFSYLYTFRRVLILISWNLPYSYSKFEVFIIILILNNTYDVIHCNSPELNTYTWIIKYLWVAYEHYNTYYRVHQITFFWKML